MSITGKIRQLAGEAILDLYAAEIPPAQLLVNATKPEFEGDYTLVLFAMVKQLKKAPEALGKELGEYLTAKHPEICTGFNVIKGFLNLVVSDTYWNEFLGGNYDSADFGRKAPNGKKVMVEYSSPNTNKPLHLGHLRNNFLGWSVAAIYRANGYEVFKSCIVNDRGIHICKSMLAWQKFAHGATPESTGIKGDHFVGDYYVQFENLLRSQATPLMEKVLAGDTSDFQGEDKEKLIKLLLVLAKPEVQADKEKAATATDDIKEIVRNNTPVMQEAKTMLLQWEAADPAVMELWRNMNSWVYAGFDTTYKRIGTDFDKIYYESNTYLLGKDIVEEGLEKNVFYRKPDASVWIDLTADGLDQKLVLRKDGTSVYITQDLGLARQKFEEFGYDESIYVIADEQNYHMKVLKLIMKKLGASYADGIFHLSYGMVDLPSGRMKSREGTVVDADELVAEMVTMAAEKTKEQGKTEGFTEDELAELYEMIGLGGLKFFLLKVDPKKRMIFNPEESIDLHGYTATFIQYAHARIRSILRKQETDATAVPIIPATHELLDTEKELIRSLEQYPETIEQACNEMSPSVIANYAFNLAQLFNSFYNKHSINNAETIEKKELRTRIALLTANILASAMALLGIKVPQRM
jgi:arginyl-tRNA synthetase